MKKLCAILCATALTLPMISCDSDSEELDGDGSGMMYNSSLLKNPESLDPQYASDESASTVMSNLYSGLMKFDDTGTPVCCNAESYTISDDGLTYTFKLREDNYWFYDTNDDDIVDDDEYFPVTAEDYAFALERILTPEMQSPYAEEFSCIKGGKELLNGSGTAASLGVNATDDTTLVITLEYASADFLNLMATSAAYPCNEEFFLSTKGRYGLDDESVMSNGAFFVRQWFYDPYGNNNILYMKANEANSTDENEVYPSFLSFTIEESDSDIRDMFKDEKLDSITTLNKNSFEKKKYTITSSQSITLGLIFNSSDKLCANQNFKNSLIYGINRESLRNQTNDDVTPAYGIIPPAVTLLGRSYRELSSDIIYNIYDEDKAVSFCEAAKDELNAESFGTIRLLVCTGSVDSSYLHILTREWQDLLGFYVSIEEVTEDEYEERIESGDYQIALYSVRGKYNSGISVLEQLAADENIGISADTKTYISNLRRCANSSDLVTQFSSAEQQVLDELTFVPIFYKNTYLIAESENRDIKFDGFSGAADYREAKHFD